MDSLMTIIQLKEFLNISRSKAYEIVKIEGFPIIKIGKCIRISKNELLKWLQSQNNVL